MFVTATTSPPAHSPHFIRNEPSHMSISAADFEKAKKMASTTASDKELIVAALNDEKRRLAQQSSQRVKNWANTIMGQRKRRLDHHAQQEREAEEGRLKADADWSLLLAKERADRIDKARLMQYMATNPIRQLHARMLLSNVLHERQLQMEHKRKLELEVRQDEEARAAGLHSLIDNEQEVKRAEKARLVQVELSIHQREETARKLAESLNERQEEKIHYTALGLESAAEAAKEVEELARKRYQQIQDAREGLEQCIKDKKHAKELEEAKAAKLNLENASFTDMKSYVTARKKDVDFKKASIMDHLSSEVAELNARLSQEKEGKLVEFEGKLERAHDGLAEKREKMERERHQRMVGEMLEDRTTKIKEAEAFEAERTAEGLKERRMMEKTWREQQEANAAVALNERMKRQELRQFHLVQIGENIKKDQTKLDEHKRQERAMAEASKLEGDRFKAYSEEVIQEFRTMGRNVEPILRGLRQHRPFPEMKYANQRRDTFDRLGFTLRNVPAFPREADPWRPKRK
ncbi:hypothetical protein DFJ73DRAFT_812614 [Zopfochytrium polystomum]|nr:hypothetical protein DFJ73DRAFT_812614 [Zopfochytrium polystomum]